MGFSDKGTGGIRDLVASAPPGCALSVGCSMSCDDDVRGGRSAEVVEIAALGSKMGEEFGHFRVVDELAQHSDGAVCGDLMGGSESVAHSEAHAVVFC